MVCKFSGRCIFDGKHEVAPSNSLRAAVAWQGNTSIVPVLLHTVIDVSPKSTDVMVALLILTPRSWHICVKGTLRAREPEIAITHFLGVWNRNAFSVSIKWRLLPVREHFGHIAERRWKIWAINISSRGMALLLPFLEKKKLVSEFTN